MFTTEAHKVLVCRFYAALDEGNLAGAYELLAPSYRVHVPGNPEQTLEGYQQSATQLYVAFPDLRHNIEDMVAEGDKVVTRLTAHGTNTGNFSGIPPTGKAVAVSEIAVFRIADGQIVEQWPQSDTLGMMQQLGLMPAPGQTAR